MLLVEGFSEIGLFRHLSKHVFTVRNFGNTKAVRVIFFSEMFKIESIFLKCSQKLIEIFVSEIIASELVSLNFVY